jgi:hypothetical protein
MALEVDTLLLAKIPGLGLLAPALGSSLGVFQAFEAQSISTTGKERPVRAFSFILRPTLNRFQTSSPHRAKQQYIFPTTALPRYPPLTFQLPYSNTSPQHSTSHTYLPSSSHIQLILPSFPPSHLNTITSTSASSTHLIPLLKGPRKIQRHEQNRLREFENLTRDSGGFSKVARCEN